MTDTGRADAIETAADWKERHDQLHETNLMLIEQLKAARYQLELQHKRASEKAMAQIDKVVTEQMQRRLDAYERIRQAASALVVHGEDEHLSDLSDALAAFMDLQQ